ncbi:hypothetical protein DFJ74DRAFT_690981 [Hyaloraphidium curvatum]|nr:hypothetical protein DFJ74DRAFT_690981 [Hyaloraphidium curvatum]
MAAEVPPSESAAPARASFEVGSQLDLVFCMDSTGSMGSYIAAARASVQAVVSAIVRSEKADVRFALVAYRDHPPEDNTFVTRTFPWTSSTVQMERNLAELSASGGGDGPEAVTAALYELSRLDFRPNAVKVCVFIADAPPHGLEPHGDGFPNGDPDGHDPLDLARKLAAMGVAVHSVACEPALSGYSNAVDFFRALSSITGGMMVPLTSACLLADAIIGGAAEQIALERLLAEQREALACDNEASEEEQSRKLYERLRSSKVTTKQLHVDDVYVTSEAAVSNLATLENAATLSGAKAALKPMAVSDRLQGKYSSGAAPGGYGYGAPLAMASAPMPRAAASKSRARPGGFLGGLLSSFGSSSSVAPEGAMMDDGIAGAGAYAYSAAPAAPPAPAQTVSLKEDAEISYEQVQRLVKMNKSRSSAA